MIFIIVLFLALFGLNDRYSYGKVCRDEISAENPNFWDFVRDLSSLEGEPSSLMKLKTRSKRDVHDSGSPVNGKNRAQTLRDYLNKIEYYIPAIRENIDKIERKYSNYYPSGQHVHGYGNSPDKISGQEYYETGSSKNMEIPWKYGHEGELSPMDEDDDRDKFIGYEDGGFKHTNLSSFNEGPNPEINWESNDDEQIESIPHFETYKTIENDDFPSNFNQNFIHENTFESNLDHSEDRVKDVGHHGMSNLCEKCGKPIYGYDENKPLVININSDCPRHPNRCCLQSRAHCRPFKSSLSSHQPKNYCSFNYRQIPRYYYH